MVLLIAAQAAALTLVDGGKSEHTIVAGAQGHPAQRFAVQELTAHVQKISGMKSTAVTPLVFTMTSQPGSAICQVGILERTTR